MSAFFGGRYEPPGGASTFRAAHEAMWEDHVEGFDSDTPEWRFWVKLAVLMSDLAGGFEAMLREDGPGHEVMYDQELWVARNYLEMTGRECPTAPAAHECDNYLPPLTCMTAPSTETGRCDKCRTRNTSPGAGDARAENRRQQGQQA